MDGWVEALLEHAAQQALLPLPALLRCGGASRRWREAVRCALPTLRALDFRGCEARVTGPDVLAALARVAGANLAAIDRSRTAGGSARRTWSRCWPARPRRARAWRRWT